MAMPVKDRGTMMAALRSMPAPGATPPAEPDAEEAGETYHLSAEQLAALNETGTVQCDEGCTITADVGGEEMPAETAGESEPSLTA